ncbi:MAG: YigZ family protein [candidate division Zixibacteria bacterium]|nr:YigZ family protein [candidate division Zixibacteria bacterium]
MMEIIDEYRTVSVFCREEIKVKGSRFIASADFAGSVDDADLFIEKISSEFHDATHNCYAYRVGLDTDINERFNDNGEPSGTAGIPILNSIKSKEMTNIICVVTRYFGGTKLGTGNLARAYSSSAIAALDKSKPVVKILKDNIEFRAPADMVSTVYHVMNKSNGKMIEETYVPEGKFIVRLRLSKIKPFMDMLTEATNGKAKFTQGQE